MAIANEEQWTEAIKVELINELMDTHRDNIDNSEDFGYTDDYSEEERESQLSSLTYDRLESIKDLMESGSMLQEALEGTK